MAPSTPLPPNNLVLAALTMASTLTRVMSPRMISTRWPTVLSISASIKAVRNWSTMRPGGNGVTRFEPPTILAFAYKGFMRLWGAFGEVSERLIEQPWKGCVRLVRTVGSNPTLSVIFQELASKDFSGFRLGDWGF